MGNNKKKMIFGVSSLLFSAILQAVFSCNLQKNWIVLVFACIYAVLFLKYLKDERVAKWLISRWGKKTLKVIGTIVLFIGITFLPQVSNQGLEGSAEFFMYVISYVCWMIGLLLLEISNEQLI